MPGEMKCRSAPKRMVTRSITRRLKRARLSPHTRALPDDDHMPPSAKRPRRHCSKKKASSGCDRPPSAKRRRSARKPGCVPQTKTSTSSPGRKRTRPTTTNMDSEWVPSSPEDLEENKNIRVAATKKKKTAPTKNQQAEVVRLKRRLAAVERRNQELRKKVQTAEVKPSPNEISEARRSHTREVNKFKRQLKKSRAEVESYQKEWRIQKAELLKRHSHALNLAQEALKTSQSQLQNALQRLQKDSLGSAALEAKIEELQETLEDRGQCSVCMDAQANTIFPKCRHVCVCERCAEGITMCPLCRDDQDPSWMAAFSWKPVKIFTG